MSYTEVQNNQMHKHKIGRTDLKVGHVKKPSRGQKCDTIAHIWTTAVVVVIANIHLLPN